MANISLGGTGNSALYKSAGKSLTTAAYSGGNKSLACLIQAVLPWTASGGSANSVSRYNNGNLSGEEPPSPFTPVVGVSSTKTDIRMSTLSQFTGSWGTYANTQNPNPTMTFKYVPCGYDTGSTTSAYNNQINLYSECTTKVVDKVNYQSINPDALPEQSASDTHGMTIQNYLSLNYTSNHFAGTIKANSISTSYAYVSPTLGNLEAITDGESFKVPDDSPADAKKTIVLMFWVNPHSFSSIPSGSQIYLWSNDESTSATSWSGYGCSCSMQADGELRFYKGDGTGNKSVFKGPRILEDAWSLVVVRLAGNGTTISTGQGQMCWVASYSRRTGWSWQNSMTLLSSTGTGAIFYSGAGNLIFAPPYSATGVYKSLAEIGHFYIFYEHAASNSSGRISFGQMEQTLATTNSASQYTS